MNPTAPAVKNDGDLVIRMETTIAQTGVEQSTSQNILETFRPLFTEAHQICATAESLSVTDATQVSEIKQARALRLSLRAVRVEADKKRKALKDESLRRGKAIDGVYNVLEFAISPVENRLREMEEFAERAEAARKAKLKSDREELLRPYVSDPTHYQLGELSAESFGQLLDGCRVAKEQRIAADKKAEAERIEREQAEAAERERIRLENEQLRREAAAREEAARKEREAAEKARREAEAKAKAERDAIEAAAAQAARIAAEKARKDREALEAKAKAEREAREKVEAEARKLREEAEKKKRAEESAARKAAAAPDRERIIALASQVRALKVPVMTTLAGQRATTSLQQRIEALANEVEQAARNVEAAA